VSASIADAVVESVTTLFPTPTVPPAPNDVQVWDNEVRSASSVDAVARDYLSRFTVQCVATNPNSNFPVTALARNLGRKVRDHLVGRTLTVDGLVVGLIVHETSEGPFKDDDVADRPVMFVVDEYAVLATA
jgi:hypothetical protein